MHPDHAYPPAFRRDVPVSSAHPGTEPPGCIALVDARFLQWMQGHERDDDAGGEPAASVRPHLMAWLAGALRAARVPVRLIRAVWYTSDAGAATLDGQVVRRVPPEAEDGGAGLVLAMERDALQLAEQRACAHLLIASDDDRLLATVDAVQARGLRVHLLADESATDLVALCESDPAWAALLRQADSRLVVSSLELLARGEPQVRGERLDRYESSDSNLDAIPPLVQAWLASLGEAARLELQGLLPTQRGLPQEADRELLQQLSHRLGRPLTVSERKLMRELARRALAERGLPEDDEARV